jgi:ATP-dependent helicase/nuclease subunit A
MLETLFRQVDYASPYGLLSTALGALGGRARLLARLGPEAAEPVDELLSAALRYESLHPAAFVGFLHWLRASQEREARARRGGRHGAGDDRPWRQGVAGAAGDLPDTVGAAKCDGGIVWGRDGVSGLEVPVWVPRRDGGGRDRRVAAHDPRGGGRGISSAALCGADAGQRPAGGLWLAAEAHRGRGLRTACAGRGSEQAGAEERPFDLGREDAWLVLEAPAAVPSTETRAARAEAVPRAALPDWMGSAPGWKATPPPVEAALMRPLAPSRPDDAPLGPQPAVRSPLAIAQARRPAAREQALRRGEIVHALLQYLPDHSPRGGGRWRWPGWRGPATGWTSPSRRGLPGRCWR